MLRWVALLGVGLTCCQPPQTDDKTPSNKPTLRAVIVNDLTPARHRPVDLEAFADETIRGALFQPERFTSTRLSNVSGCAAEVGVYYGFIVNGQLEKTAEQGQAKLILEGELHCPVSADSVGDIETFRIHLKRQQAFGADPDVHGEQTLRSMLGTLSETFADAVIAQMATRKSSDDEIVNALSESHNVGVLMEGASEAGERRLTEALPSLIRLTAHPDSVVSLRAGSALGMLAVKDPDALKALAAMTEGPDPERHLIAIHALGDIGGTRALRYLDTLAIGHPDPAMRDAARLTSLRIKDQLGADSAPGSGHDAPPKP